MTALVIVGAGGFGREVFEIVRAMREAATAAWRVEGYVDDTPSFHTIQLLDRMGTKLLGPVDRLLESPGDVSVVLAVGDPQVRRELSARLVPANPHYAVLIHPDATVGHGVDLGPGTVVCPGARLSTQISLGAHVQIDQNVTVGHDTAIGNFSRLNPQACVSGSVHIEDCVVVGASATVLQGLHIGSGAIVGAGAVVTRRVSSNTIVKGVPAQ